MRIHQNKYLNNIPNRISGDQTDHQSDEGLQGLKRVRVLIERLYGVTFSEVHVWRLLGALGFSSQKPERRAIERNEEAVLTWKRKT
ncbi:helix-turn-helix domain-containing protein [Paraburkholderia youngii]|uniref:Winged helix-turn-helix domain-containing protein n=1 Tax=Paraburkholderia youngii TaxID=2782701 RepID=A0A7Y6K9I1_9BURK|nr:winged helix-turn-helix domain-containing protein [Paraburkholderia youngii]